ncbi:MAG: class I SAM-dependent methyltransferase [Actinomycetota bacterium]
MGSEHPSGADRDDARLGVEDILTQHRAHVDRVLPTGDSAAIKALYVELGGSLESSLGDSEAPPLLSFPETLPVVVDLLSEARGLILDAGCGPNPAVSLALGRVAGCTMVALDISLGSVRLARAFAGRAGVSLRGVVGDLEALPFRSGAFDAAVCDDTVEHLPDDRVGVRELARVVAAGGHVVVATPNRHNLQVLCWRARDWVRGRRRPTSAYFAASSHLREYGWREFEGLVEPSLVIRRRATVAWSRGWKGRLASRLVRRGPLRRLGRVIVIEAEPRGGD